MNTVTLVGSGLVGSLMTCYLGRRGFNVEVFEKREDIRLAYETHSKSINMAVSVRGLNALKKLNLDEEFINQNAIPMIGRLIHNINGSTKIIPYGKSNQCIYSISRRKLNEFLINKAETYSNVKINFNKKLVKIDFKSTECYFVDNKLNNLSKQQESICKKSDFIIGADGAYSMVRNQLMQQDRFNYEQFYIDHGYIELYIPPKLSLNSIEFAMKKNYLHIWPREKFMLIALPNLDKSFTVTLFMPFDNFDNLQTEQQLINFFQIYFSDALQLIGKQQLIQTYFNNRPSSLISIKLSPYNFLNKCILIGDAAHAMVPFYGQGMNCGFEDCRILDDFLQEYTMNLDNLTDIFNRYNEERNENCKAICDLALYNYIEMRHSVNTLMFLFRKKLDFFLNLFLQNHWIPLYSMITFSNIPYKLCLEKKKNQDRYLMQIVKIVLLSFLVATLTILYMNLD